MPTRDYIVQTEGNRQLLLNKQDDGKFQVKLFLNRENTKRTLRRDSPIGLCDSVFRLTT